MNNDIEAEEVVRTALECERIATEYEGDLQEFLIDVQKDVVNKLSHRNKEDQMGMSTAILQYILFDQICRVLSYFDSPDIWSFAFNNMYDEFLEQCLLWKEFLKTRKKR